MERVMVRMVSESIAPRPIVTTGVRRDFDRAPLLHFPFTLTVLCLVSFGSPGGFLRLRRSRFGPKSESWP